MEILLWEPVRPLLFAAAAFFAAFLLSRIVFARLARLAQKTSWDWDDLVLQALRGPSALWCLIFAVYVALQASPASAGTVRLGGAALTALWIVSLTVVALRISDQAIARYGKSISTALPLTTLTQNLTRAVILITGGLIVLNSFGISIAPILTALGVGGIAVALALQDTLSNLFSGIYVTVARQVRVGDYIKLDSGQEGFVIDISWRATRVRTGAGNLVIVPNTKLASAIVTNFDLPSQDMVAGIELSAAYGSDLDKVERVTLDVAKEILAQKELGGVPDFEPVVRFHTFGASSVNFTAVLRVRTFGDQALVKHEFIKRLLRRYAQEKIVIPLPTQTTIVENRTP